MSKSREYISELAAACLRGTESLMVLHKLRIAGTEPCRLASQKIASVLRETCDDVSEETFTLRPRALWCVGKAVSISYVLAGILWFLGGAGVYAAGLISVMGTVYAFSQYVVCAELFDGFFPSAEGRNVAGKLDPSGEARQQIIIVGHHDSPYIFSFLSHWQQVALLRLFLGVGFYLYLVFATISASFQQAFGGSATHLEGPQFWIVAAGMLFVLPLFFMVTNTPSPGAGDNLNSTFLAAAVMRHFQKERKDHRSLQQTRLICLTTDGEEIGQRGAIEYVRRHKIELRAIPTYVVNLDSIYSVKDLRICTRDRNFTTKLSGRMAEELKKAAGKKGYCLRKMPIPFGGGGTDAAAFAVAGIDATSIIGLPTGLLSRSSWYHTAKDTVDRIESKAVEAVLETIIEYIVSKDI